MTTQSIIISRYDVPDPLALPLPLSAETPVKYVEPKPTFTNEEEHAPRNNPIQFSPLPQTHAETPYFNPSLHIDGQPITTDTSQGCHFFIGDVRQDLLSNQSSAPMAQCTGVQAEHKLPPKSKTTKSTRATTGGERRSSSSRGHSCSRSKSKCKTSKKKGRPLNAPKDHIINPHCSSLAEEDTDSSLSIDAVLAESNDLLQAASDAQALGRLVEAQSYLYLAHARLIGLGQVVDRRSEEVENIEGLMNEVDEQVVECEYSPSDVKCEPETLFSPTPDTVTRKLHGTDRRIFWNSRKDRKSRNMKKKAETPGSSTQCLDFNDEKRRKKILDESAEAPRKEKEDNIIITPPHIVSSLMILNNAFMDAKALVDSGEI
eukprot:scaffold258_cov201-Alexandrium_tamarense.AAC.3